MMLEDRRQLKQTARRFLRALSLLNPRRIVRFFRSVSYRLDALRLLIESESATALERSRESALQLEKQIRDRRAAGTDGYHPPRTTRSGGVRGCRPSCRPSCRRSCRSSRRSSADFREDLGAHLHSATTKTVDMVKLLIPDRWKFQEYEGLLRYLQAAGVLDRAIRDGRLAVPQLETDHPVAISSNDTKFPRGSKNDNSIAPRFNHKLYEFLGQRQPSSCSRSGVRGRWVCTIADRRRSFRGGARRQRLPLC